MALPSTAASDLHRSSLFRHQMSEMSTAEDRSQALAHFSIRYTGKLNGREFLWISGTALDATVYWKLKWPKIVHRTQPAGKLNSSFLLLVTAVGVQRNLEKHQEERNQRRKITGKCGKRTANSSWRQQERHSTDQGGSEVPELCFHCWPQEGGSAQGLQCGWARSAEQLGPLEASACLIEALSSAATTWDSLDAHEGAIQQEVCEGQCLRLTRQDIMHHYVCRLLDAYADLTDGRCCHNLPSPCWPKTNSSLSPFLPQPPSALLARVFEAKLGEGDN